MYVCVCVYIYTYIILYKVRNVYGLSPLHWAALYGHTGTARYLLKECALAVNPRENSMGLAPVQRTYVQKTHTYIHTYICNVYTYIHMYIHMYIHTKRQILKSTLHSDFYAGFALGH
jgi:hypothetical protein